MISPPVTYHSVSPNSATVFSAAITPDFVKTVGEFNIAYGLRISVSHAVFITQSRHVQLYLQQA